MEEGTVAPTTAMASLLVDSPSTAPPPVQPELLSRGQLPGSLDDPASPNPIKSVEPGPFRTSTESDNVETPSTPENSGEQTTGSEAVPSDNSGVETVDADAGEGPVKKQDRGRPTPIACETITSEPSPASPVTDFLKGNAASPGAESAGGGGSGSGGPSSKDELSVFVGTWNMHGQKPPPDLLEFVNTGRNRYDIIVVGTEECERSIEASMILRTKQSWEKQLSATIGDSYYLLRSQNLVAIHIVVYVRRKLQFDISNTASDYVACGIGDVMGNKGGVAISFSLREKQFLFINAHLAAHQHMTEKRNEGYHKIIRELRLPPGSSVEDGNVLERFDHIFFCGDLNYRINGNRQIVDRCLEQNMAEVLLQNDQLNIEMGRKRAFTGFQEGAIHFNPTYKFDAGTDNYDSSKKQRIPSWTDRVLYRSKDPRACKLITYADVPALKTSDHRPVFAEFEVQVTASTNPLQQAAPASATCTLL